MGAVTYFDVVECFLSLWFGLIPKLFFWYLCVYLSPLHLFQGPMHSYREAFEDSEADGFANSPTFGGGGENSPQTPSFPVSPQTPYFNMCRFTLPADRWRSQIL